MVWTFLTLPSNMSGKVEDLGASGGMYLYPRSDPSSQLRMTHHHTIHSRRVAWSIQVPSVAPRGAGNGVDPAAREAWLL